VTSRRLVFLLLLFVSLDFAVPYEPTARGWQEYEDEEESVHPEARRLERPGASLTEPSGTRAASRPRPAATARHRASRQAAEPVTRLPRADTSSSPPPASPEAH
jgi:hypothetical protein